MGDTETVEPVSMTGTELADKLGCHHTTVSRWRNGHRLPGVELLYDLSTVTEIPYPELLEAWKGGEKVFAPFFRKRILGEAR